jgi:hypothetical protein
MVTVAYVKKVLYRNFVLNEDIYKKIKIKRILNIWNGIWKNVYWRNITLLRIIFRYILLSGTYILVAEYIEFSRFIKHNISQYDPPQYDRHKYSIEQAWTWRMNWSDILFESPTVRFGIVAEPKAVNWV